MRNLFFALLFLNLALLAWWHFDGQSSKAAAALPAGPSIPTLELAKVSAPSPGPASPVTSTRCRSLGPFADPAAATAASDLMRARGWQPRDRSVDTSAPDGYWVYIGQLTAAAQKTVLARLNAAGIRDAASMTQPEQSDGVSVGFFADQTHAVRRAEQVRALGLKPVLDIHERSVPVHWLDVDLKTTDPDLQAKVFQTGNSLQVTDCPTKATGG